MTHSPQRGFFRRNQPLLVLFSTAYVLSLALSHATLPHAYVWWIALFFSVLMNFTYVIEARTADDQGGTEQPIALFLILLSILGVIASPLFLIAAILLHGVWDAAKHWGAGIKFFSWYTWGCAVVDTCYSGALLLFYLR